MFLWHTLGRPEALSVPQGIEVFFRDGECPAVSVALLAASDLADKKVGLGLQLHIPGLLAGAGRCAEPVPGKSPANLAGGGIPAAVGGNRVVEQPIQARLGIVGKEQVFRFQLHQVVHLGRVLR